MLYTLSVHAHDMLDQVAITATLHDWDVPPEDRPMLVGRWSETVQGTGESDPHVWTRDALVAIIEAL